MADWHDPTYLGKLNPKVWSDIDDLDSISTRPDGELHRHTEKYIFESAAKHGDRLKTAIICPPDIYGPGRGPGKTQSVYFPVFWDEIQKVGSPFYAGDGANTRSWVHIEDLMTVYLKLVEAAVAGGEGAEWGREVDIAFYLATNLLDLTTCQGYYFTSSQEASQIDIARAVGKILKAHGRIDDAEPKQLPLDTVKAMLSEQYRVEDIGAYMFAANSRTRAHRATKLFGYEPKGPRLWDTIEADLLACLK